ncbi:hypothetical protein SAMN04490244_1065 [Tranquillimonas rosea]|uniref:Uncharacterized protein n=1 Tax=Tranquillimonas rosea TaxID=641238 RepID=A0A1H9UV10_9RHOB|nr:hypothetical protein SAMN04490244_1065 [Tranquillimonas rosea]
MGDKNPKKKPKAVKSKPKPATVTSMTERK